jgi:hypothetical protein
MIKTPKWLERASERSSERGWTLGSVIDEFQRIEGMSRDQVAAFLGCNADTLAWLSLCRKPAPEQFAEEVSRVAERFQVDTAKLAQLVRRTEAIAVLRKVKAPDEETLLLAARDRDEERKK